MRLKPARYSLVSANGPSNTVVRCWRTRNERAVAGGSSCCESSTQPAARSSSACARQPRINESNSPSGSACRRASSTYTIIRNFIGPYPVGWVGRLWPAPAPDAASRQARDQLLAQRQHRRTQGGGIALLHPQVDLALVGTHAQLEPRGAFGLGEEGLVAQPRHRRED